MRRTSPERKRSQRKMPQWRPFGDEIHDLKKPLRIDAEVRKLADLGKLTENWSGPTGFAKANCLSRRALEIAIWQAKSADDGNLSPVIEDWGTISTRAAAAHKALKALIEILGPKSMPGQSIQAEHLVLPIVTSKALDRSDRRGSVEAAQREAGFRASQLFDVAQFTDAVAVAARKQATALRADWDDRGDKPFQEFSKILGEAWFCLTERLPSPSPEAGTNRFVRFLDAAWHDAGGKVETVRDTDPLTVFVNGAKLAREFLKAAGAPHLATGELPVLEWFPLWSSILLPEFEVIDRYAADQGGTGRTVIKPG